MKYLIRKEIAGFFSSSMGYVILFVWLLAVSLMLWFFAGEYNLLDGGFATLRPFFSLAPVLFLLLVPSVTMRMFAEEKRMGTLELLFSRPIKISTIVVSKFWSAWLLMVIALIPTLIYLISILSLSTAGIDSGEIIGGYFGLLCLLAAFVSIGLFSSSLTSNQLIAFLIAALLSFATFYGFELIASLTSNGSLHNTWAQLGVQAHYQSMSRGVIDTRDLIYFASVTIFFIYLTIQVNTRKR
ncbi:ABC transporter permease subunit [Bacteroides sedimenti]|uniref:Gliding motility-associated ABC transporter permease subunit GldF n=1 Tax=Bacteroides sedimenti TaxID=2136147 RepID=A0ABN6Z787_9BACE